MRRRWQLILPTIGLVLFGGVTYESLEGRRYEKTHGRYFWWASIRLDTHQVDQGPVTTPCKEAEDNCVSWDPLAIEDPGWLTRALLLSAFPTFLVGIPLVRVLGRHGGQRDLELHRSDAVVDRRLVLHGRLAHRSLEI